MKDLLLAVLEFGPVFELLVMIAESPVTVFGVLAVATLTAIGVGVALDRAGARVPLPEIGAVTSAAVVLLSGTLLFVEPADREPLAADESADADMSSDSTNGSRQTDR